MSALLTADAIGWAATAVFTASYFARQPDTLRRVQMGGAAIWLAYGVATHALPVITANMLVLGAATWAGRRQAVRVTAAPSIAPLPARR